MTEPVFNSVNPSDLEFIMSVEGQLGIGISNRTEAGGFTVFKWAPPNFRWAPPHMMTSVIDDSVANEADLICEALVREISRPIRWTAIREAWLALLNVRRISKNLLDEAYGAHGAHGAHGAAAFSMRGRKDP